MCQASSVVPLPACALAGCRTVQVYSTKASDQPLTAYYCPRCDAITVALGRPEGTVSGARLVWRRDGDAYVLRDQDRLAWEELAGSSLGSWEPTARSFVATFLRGRDRDWIHCPVDAEDAAVCYREATPGGIRWRLASCRACGTLVLEAHSEAYGWERLMSVLPAAGGGYRILREYPASLARPEAREVLARAAAG